MCLRMLTLAGVVSLYAKVVSDGGCICSMSICNRRCPMSIVARRIEGAGAASKRTTGHYVLLPCVFVLAVVTPLFWVS